MSLNHIHLYEGDLPGSLSFGPSVAIDTETMGLNPKRDKLCLVQLSAGDGQCHMVKFDIEKPYEAPNLKKLLSNPKILKIFHFARFDLGILYHTFGIMPMPVYCTKVASKFGRTYAPKHGLKELCTSLLNQKLDKEQQSSDWSAPTLSKEQLAYAAHDVLYLHALKEILDQALIRTGREGLAQVCFNFLPTVAALDLQGWEVGNLFAHD
ncbi:MAG: ribonuclease D [Alphaproteobacteria bacterium]|nr:ribonuclease D [Alphaproteobacteria bacterium]